MAKIKNSDKTEAIKLLNKVKELSERGERGERDNAQALLNKLLKKYNLKSIDLDSYKRRIFKLTDYNDCKVIMIHCILDTIPSAEIEGSRQKKELYCKITDGQYIEICEKFRHYYPIIHNQMQEHDRQRDSLLKAFLLKNNLGIIDSNDECIEDISSICDMMSVAEENKFNKNYKLINNGN